MKVRILNSPDKNKPEIIISEQDNSLASLLEGSETIRYTSISVDREILPEEDFNKIKLHFDPSKEMVQESNKLHAAEALLIFNKLTSKLREPKTKSLNADLAAIDKLDLSSDVKEKRKQDQILWYLEFEYSFDVLLGVLKVGAMLNWEIQLVAQYY